MTPIIDSNKSNAPLSSPPPASVSRNPYGERPASESIAPHQLPPRYGNGSTSNSGAGVGVANSRNNRGEAEEGAGRGGRAAGDGWAAREAPRKGGMFDEGYGAGAGAGPGQGRAQNAFKTARELRAVVRFCTVFVFAKFLGGGILFSTRAIANDKPLLFVLFLRKMFPLVYPLVYLSAASLC